MADEPTITYEEFLDEAVVPVFRGSGPEYPLVPVTECTKRELFVGVNYLIWNVAPERSEPGEMSPEEAYERLKEEGYLASSEDVDWPPVTINASVLADLLIAATNYHFHEGGTEPPWRANLPETLRTAWRALHGVDVELTHIAQYVTDGDMGELFG